VTESCTVYRYAFLLFSYAVLPPVSRKLFQALDCVPITDGSYLRIDTSVQSCILT